MNTKNQIYDTHTHTRTNTHIHRQTHTHTQTHTHKHSHTHTHTHRQTHTHTHKHTLTHTDKHTLKHTLTHTYRHTQTNTHTHTHKHTKLATWYWICVFKCCLLPTFHRAPYVRLHSKAWGGCSMCHKVLLHESHVAGVRKCRGMKSWPLYITTPARSWKEQHHISNQC